MKKKMKQSVMTMLVNAITVVLSVGVLLSLVGLITFNSKIDIANTNRYNLTYNANRFMNGSAYLTNEVRAYAATGNIAHFNNYWNEVNTLKNRDIAIAELKEIGITEEEQAKIDEMSALSNNLVPLEDEAMKVRQEGDEIGAIDMVYGDYYNTTIDQINKIKTEFLNMLDQRSLEQVNTLQKTNTLLKILSMAFLLAVIIVQAISQYIVRRKILKPLITIKNEMEEISKGNLSSDFSMEPDTSEIGALIYAMLCTRTELKRYIDDISAKLMQMSEGDLRVSMDLDYIGDFEPIKKSLSTIVTAFNDTLYTVKESANVVTDGTEQLAQNMHTLSQGAVEQSSSIQELAHTMADMSKGFENTAKRAVEVKDTTEMAESELGGSNVKMQEMIQAIVAINEKSNEIGKIIKTIEDIAFQTNILALNAAVEAARAGEAGKGFAVVADEVRNLASKSAEAAQETTVLIEDSIRAVENGTKIANETAEAMRSVVGGAQAVSDMVQGIVENTDQQASKVVDVKMGVDNIAEVVRSNSSVAEQTAAVSEELSAQAHGLQIQINRFKLKNK